MKKVSIIVPCCNVEKYVRECLESIRAQTYTNIEVICINDGSKDNTGAIIDEYVAADSRFQAIHKPNTGYGDSMNMGLERCTGDYVGIVESDDWIEPNMYEVLLETCERNSLDLTHCLWYKGPTGTERVRRYYRVKKGVIYSPLDRPYVFYLPSSIWAALYRRDLLEDGRKVRFLPTPGASFQDLSFAFKCYTKATRFMYLNKVLHHYRINPASSSSSSGKIYCIIDEWEEICRWIDEDADLKQLVVCKRLLVKLFHIGLKWNCRRLAGGARLEFLRAASHFFKKAHEDGLIDLDIFWGFNRRCREIKQVMNDPEKFYSKRWGTIETQSECAKNGDSPIGHKAQEGLIGRLWGRIAKCLGA